MHSGARSALRNDELEIFSLLTAVLALGLGASVSPYLDSGITVMPSALFHRQLPVTRPGLLPRASLAGATSITAKINALDSRNKGLAMKCRDRIVEDVVGIRVRSCDPGVQFAIWSARSLLTRMVTRPLDRARDVLGDRGGELHEFATRTFEREQCS